MGRDRKYLRRSYSEKGAFYISFCDRRNLCEIADPSAESSGSNGVLWLQTCMTVLPELAPSTGRGARQIVFRPGIESDQVNTTGVMLCLIVEKRFS